MEAEEIDQMIAELSKKMKDDPIPMMSLKSFRLVSHINVNFSPAMYPLQWQIKGGGHSWHAKTWQNCMLAPPPLGNPCSASALPAIIIG